jgi:hypothetical protein
MPATNGIGERNWACQAWRLTPSRRKGERHVVHVTQSSGMRDAGHASARRTTKCHDANTEYGNLVARDGMLGTRSLLVAAGCKTGRDCSLLQDDDGDMTQTQRWHRAMRMGKRHERG